MYSNRFWRFVIAVAIISVAEIALSAPLFRTLGFEYSALMAIVLSFACGVYAAKLPRPAARTDIFRLLRRTVILWLVPLVVSLCSLVFIRNCAFWDGLLLYVEIALPSALLGAGFGAVISSFLKSPRAALWTFVGFWTISLVVSLLPGYTNPQLYTYGWQYGFFPGLTWDESIDLSNAYLIFRIENALWLLLLLGVTHSWYERRAPTTRTIFSLALAIALMVSIHFNDSVGITTSHDLVARKLNEQFTVDRATIRYATDEFTSDEVQKIAGDVRWYLHDIRGKYQLEEYRPITVYIYPSAQALFDLIGTRSASISKPWLSELHIAKENLNSLKHELTHVLLREKGSWPFYASWSTGLTEGAAMAVEYDYDGIYTLDEHAANILRLHYASGVKEVMAFSGFAANASQKSYVLAGSFSRFLLAVYGADKFNRVYTSLSFEKEYGRSLDTLEAEWKRWLAPLMHPLSTVDSLHFRYYYDRASILFNPCLRRIGKLERRAERAYREKRYTEAEELYRSAAHEGGGLTPLVMESYVMVHRNNIAGALRLLDTDRSPGIRNQAAALYSEKADLRVLVQDSGSQQYYDSAQCVKIGASTFLSAWISSVLERSDIAPLFERYLLYSYQSSDSMRRATIDSMIQALPASRPGLQSIALNELRFRSSVRLGNLRDAIAGDQYSALSEALQGLTQNDSLALAVMYRERRELGETVPDRQFCPTQYRAAAVEVQEEWDRRKRSGY